MATYIEILDGVHSILEPLETGELAQELELSFVVTRAFKGGGGLVVFDVVRVLGPTTARRDRLAGLIVLRVAGNALVPVVGLPKARKAGLRLRYFSSA